MILLREFQENDTLKYFSKSQAPVSGNVSSVRFEDEEGKKDSTNRSSVSSDSKHSSSNSSPQSDSSSASSSSGSSTNSSRTSTGTSESSTVIGCVHFKSLPVPNFYLYEVEENFIPKKSCKISKIIVDHLYYILQ